jgi:hypothetical protein
VQIGAGSPLAQGTTDCSGGATIEFMVPSTVMPALHLVDVIISGTAITAECVVRVVAN